MDEKMIRAENLEFRYTEEGKKALNGVSMQVKKGEFVAVLGANGCGKSTLAKHFNAILLPEKGDVWVEEFNTKEEEHLYDIRQRVGMVFQNPDNQIVATMVEEDVAFALENLGVPHSAMPSSGNRGTRPWCMNHQVRSSLGKFRFRGGMPSRSSSSRY